MTMTTGTFNIERVLSLAIRTIYLSTSLIFRGQLWPTTPSNYRKNPYAPLRRYVAEQKNRDLRLRVLQRR